MKCDGRVRRSKMRCVGVTEDMIGRGMGEEVRRRVPY